MATEYWGKVFVVNSFGAAVVLASAKRVGKDGVAHESSITTVESHSEKLEQLCYLYK